MSARHEVKMLLKSAGLLELTIGRRGVGCRFSEEDIESVASQQAGHALGQREVPEVNRKRRGVA
jgi:hypothetical protein